MARDEAPPFARGETWYGGRAKDADLTDPLHMLGKEFVFEPNSPNDYAARDSSGRAIRVRVVQNKSGIPLLPKRIVRFKAADPAETLVDGYPVSATLDQVAGVVDEFLPPGGVAIDDIFFIVVDGQTTLKTVIAGLTTLAVGDRVELAAGTSNVHNDAGRVNKAAGTVTVDTLVARAGRSEVVNSVADSDLRAVVHFRSRY